MRAGKVRHIAASNLSGERLTESLEVSWREGLAEYVALQPHYNLIERAGYESEYAPIVAEHNLAVLPYYGLAKGFLTGKYRPGGPEVDSPRAKGALAYLDERGERVLAALDQVAAERAATGRGGRARVALRPAGRRARRSPPRAPSSSSRSCCRP